MQKNIAVVGAGFAGLAAALELHGLGFAVTVLEARQRVGGRVWSKKLPNGAIVELGAEWVGPGDATVFAMAKRLDLPLAEVGVDFMTRDVVNGSAVSRDDQHRAVRIAAETLAAMEDAAVAHSTVGEFLEDLPVSEPQRTLLCARLQCSFGTDLHKIALRMLGGGFGVGGDRRYYRAATGNQSLAEAMAARLPDVRLEHAVTAVTQDQAGATINGQATDGAFEVEADAVVSAMPVRLLAELRFDPTLPPVVAEAISSVPMGVAAKLAIGTRNDPPLRAVQDVEIPYWCWTGRGADDHVRAAVTAFCGSKQAQRNLDTDSDDPSTWLGKLQSVNPDLDFVNEAIMVDWSQDEWARGCYSAFDNQAMEFIPLLSRPVGRLFFAGEHTHGESGTMEGALASGLRAAQQAAERLGSA